MHDFSPALCILMKGFWVFLPELIYQKLLLDYNNNIHVHIPKNVKYRYEHIFLHLALFRKL